MERFKLLFVAAARPNFMKIGPIMNAFKGFEDQFECRLVHTGQHYDPNMSDTFFTQLNIPKPDYHLGVGGGSYAEQTAKVMLAFEPVLLEYQPDLLVVVGDVNATLACSLTASKLHIKVAHVEAGLRSFDWSMPEEVNRILTDRLSQYLFTTLEDDHQNLFNEGFSSDQIILIGNVMIDTLFNNLEKAAERNFISELGLAKSGFNLLTMHRPSNVDDKVTFERLLSTLSEIAQERPIVWPLHPRSKSRMEQFGLTHYITHDIKQKGRIFCIDPVGYHEMINLVMNSDCVFTDSGGLQEETSALKVPCITLRENTERPVTVSRGSSVLVGTDSAKIRAAYANRDSKRHCQLPPSWDGKASERLRDNLSRIFFSQVKAASLV